VIVGDDRQRNSAGVGDRASGLDRVAPGGGTARAPPTRPLTLTGQDDGYPLWLSRQQRGDGDQLVFGRTTVDHRPWWMRMQAPKVRPVDQAQLEEGEVIGTATHVPAHRGKEPRQQGGAQLRLLVGEWIGQHKSAASGVIGRQAHVVVHLWRQERVALHFDVARSREHDADASPKPLTKRES
jgi:hypothetical protein